MRSVPAKEATSTLGVQFGRSDPSPISSSPNKSAMNKCTKKANASRSCLSGSISLQRTGFQRFNAYSYHSQALSNGSLLAGSFRSIRLAMPRAYAIRKHQSGPVTRQLTVSDSILLNHISSAARTATATCHVHLACRILKGNRFGKLQRAEKNVAIVTSESRQGHRAIIELQRHLIAR